MDPKIIDRVLSRVATPEEGRKVAEWFATDEGQEYFSRRYDRETYLLNEKIIMEWLDAEIPAEKLKHKILAYIRNRIRTNRFKVAAAALIPLIILGGSLLFVLGRTGVLSAQEFAEISVPNGETLQLVLQDGTSVRLNSASTLQYPKRFSLFNRKVKLSGEGYFTVAKDRKRPFIVDLDLIDVEVTGTAFDVKAYPNEDILVALDAGSVNIIDNKKNIYPLLKGQNAHFDRGKEVCVIKETTDPAEYIAWMSKRLNFYRAPLKDILNTLTRQYDVLFDVKDKSILELKFSIVSSETNIDSVLRELEVISNIRFVSKDDKIYEVINTK